MPKSERYDQQLFAGSASGSGTNPSSMERLVEETLRQKCSVLTVGQRCADWFIMRQFRITGTNAGVILLNNEHVRRAAGIQGALPAERTQKAWLDILIASWFSSERSTEAMMRGSVNEEAVLAAPLRSDFIVAIFSCGMFAVTTESFMACSPDGVALIDTSVFPVDAEECGDANVTVDGKRLSLAAVEVKTSVSAASLGSILSLACGEVVFCRLGDDKFKQYVSSEHVGQLLQQMTVMHVNFVLYVRCGEAGIIFKVLVCCNRGTLELCTAALRSVGTTCASWAHEGAAPPVFADRKQKEALMSRFSFWNIVNTYVSNEGPLPPIEIFKHGVQSIYSKTKGGVDGATQARAVLRSCNSHLKWDKNWFLRSLRLLLLMGSLHGVCFSGNICCNQRRVLVR